MYTCHDGIVALTQQQVQPHIARFLAVIEKTSGCWYLSGRARSNGYSTIQIDGTKTSGHRFAYAAFVGDIPGRYEIDHLCRDRACVNPAHLQLVSRAENLRRRDSFGKPLGHLPVFDRLLARRHLDVDGCWIWTGARVRGYGVASIENRTQYVHRVAYQLAISPLSETVTIDHLCRRPACFNPEHLEAVSRSENSRRVPFSERRPRTCRNGHLRENADINPGVSCTVCNPERSRKGSPRRTPSDIESRCPKGHTYAETGRYPSGGCIACQLVKDAARRKGPRPPVQFCPRGHDTFMVGRTSGNGECRECAREYARRRYGYQRTAAELANSCRNGHERTPDNTRITKRERKGKERTERICLDCRREAVARYEAKRREKLGQPG
ncbi:HNH endonuclease signature motif containing protein [Micromonospora sp. NPDC049523]|uniref:HNH endonuclease signature motif containing protein n=1 Tax=Micromonospora sp. NPDC049523 TaxID=3155921 RepID=UPI0034262692